MSNGNKAIITKKIAEGNNYEEVLDEVILNKPKAEGRDLLIRVKAVATNPIDNKVLGAKFGPSHTTEKPITPGWDGAGIVEEVGDGVELFNVGDEVYFAGSLIRDGCFAEYVLIDERIAALKPKRLSFAESAAIPLTTLTAWEAFVRLLNIEIPKTNEEKESNAKKVVLIIAGAGGVGSIAIQLAKKVLNLTVIASASRSETVEWCKKQGADFVINHYQPLLAQIEGLGFKGVQYVLTCCDVTAKNFDEYIDCCVPFARIAFIISSSETVNLGKLMFKSLSISGELMFTRPMYGDDLQYQHEILTKTAELLDSSVLHTTKNTELTFNLENLVRALQLQLSGKSIGKIVLVRQ